MPNESVSGFTDEQLQQIRDVAQQVADSSTGQVAESLGSVQDAVVSSVSESVVASVASALDSRSGQTVALVGDQWDSLSGYVSLSSDSARFVNTVLILELLLVAIVIGVLFFAEFSRGFRR